MQCTALNGAIYMSSRTMPRNHSADLQAQSHGKQTMQQKRQGSLERLVRSRSQWERALEKTLPAYAAQARNPAELLKKRGDFLCTKISNIKRMIEQTEAAIARGGR